MITYDNVTKIYQGGDVRAVEDVSVKIEEGEFVFLIGPSGAGKTTLLRFLIREDRPTSGDIWYKEENVVKIPAHKIPQLRRRIGMVFQDFKLLQQQTVEENVSFALEVTGKNSKEIKEVVPYLLEKVGLSDRMGAYPRELSTGEQQRVAIARALVHEPEVLLADEPTGNLDYDNAKQIVELLRQINDWGTTVIMATHDEGLIKKAKKARVLKLEDGRLEEK
ncbi:cell division ATP-binding protein FtsE [candidate division WWE3 bacterium]|uniref:Cell division ATP-binding protein FtsE n=1 Tax=candidate division WWE3 bacterium TaxID=2053526 RepID=A0A955LJZ6_UNCKA|nr:cell division ATP-binding protein FtsE [candidate division WWE3 bacterium]